MQLRDYQEQALQQVRSLIQQGYKKILIVSPTGSGKGTLLAYMAGNVVKNSTKRTTAAILAHRVELLTDTAKRIYQITGVTSTIVAPSFRKTNYPLKLWSVQTLIRRDWPKTDWIFIDEAHRTAANSYQKALEKHRGPVIGFTATPVRLDGKPMSNDYDAIVQVIKTEALIAKKFLVPSNHLVIANDIDFDSIQIKKTVDGLDYDTKQLSTAFGSDEMNCRIVEAYEDYGNGASCIAFTTSVANGKSLKDAFVSAGVTCEVLSGDSNDLHRRKTITAFEQRKIKMLINVGLFVEGIDLPACDGVLLCYKTLSPSKYIQCIGRGARPMWDKLHKDWLKHEDGTYVKPTFLVLDFGDNVYMHGKWEWFDKGGFTLGEVPETKTPKSQDCPQCNNIMPYSLRKVCTCPVCGYEIQPFLDNDGGGKSKEDDKQVSINFAKEMTGISDIDAFKSMLLHKKQKEFKQVPTSFLRCLQLLHRLNEDFCFNELVRRGVDVKSVTEARLVLQEQELKDGIATYYNEILASTLRSHRRRLQ